LNTDRAKKAGIENKTGAVEAAPVGYRICMSGYMLLQVQASILMETH